MGSKALFYQHMQRRRKNSCDRKHRPREKGSYIFKLDIVKEGSEWYSDSGVKFPHIAVKVCDDGSALMSDLYEQIEAQKLEEEHWKHILHSGEYDFFIHTVKLIHMADLR